MKEGVRLMQEYIRLGKNRDARNQTIGKNKDASIERVGANRDACTQRIRKN